MRPIGSVFDLIGCTNCNYVNDYIVIWNMIWSLFYIKGKLNWPEQMQPYRQAFLPRNQKLHLSVFGSSDQGPALHILNKCIFFVYPKLFMVKTPLRGWVFNSLRCLCYASLCRLTTSNDWVWQVSLNPRRDRAKNGTTLFFFIMDVFIIHYI